MTSLRDSILSADDLERKQITVAGWEFPVWVRVISGRERQQLVQKWNDVKDDEAAMQDLLPFVCALCLVDPDGGRPFDPTDQADLDLLKGKGARQLEDVYHAAMTLNGMEDEALDEAVANFQ
tara:strand:- start:173 stop:538 length:366 start_codon:yes stop_codon:yes gene_type:complete